MPDESSWETKLTKVQPDNLIISGYPLQELIGNKTLLDVAHLLVAGDLPDVRTREGLRKIAIEAVMLPAPQVDKRVGEDISKGLAKCILLDEALANYPDRPTRRTAFALGRMARYLAKFHGTEAALADISEREAFSSVIYRVFAGKSQVDEKRTKLLEAMVTACVDHGVTPPSAQATILATSTRAAYETCLAQGVSVITDVHGGAGAKAATFFMESTVSGKELKAIINDYTKQKKRIPGLGHRVHNNDPRRDVLWNLAAESGIAGPNIRASREISGVFREVVGKDLPINVDGVIGAIIADLGFDAMLAKSVFIFGRVAGLSAHHYEEMARPVMRKIDFAKASYSGKPERKVPGGA